MPPVLFLIDGHALAYRAYFAISGSSSDRLQTRAGEPTAGILGFANVLLKLLEQEKPEFLAVAFDVGRTFRDDIYPAYKGTREKMPDDLRPQIERIREMVDLFHFPRLEMEGFEADDVLGSVARQAVARGLGVKIITGDRDLLQLVDDRIIVNLPGGKFGDAKDYTAPDVKAYLGVLPEQVVDYKALVGDSSDNIPGVPGVGPKTAVDLLGRYETLEGVYAHLEELKGSVKARLEAGREMAEMSRTLARIRTDVPVVINLDEARTDHIDFAAVEKFFLDLEFSSLPKRLRNLRGPQPGGEKGQLSLFATETPIIIGEAPQYKIQVHLVDTPEKLAGMVKALNASGMIAFDTETTSTDPIRAQLVGISAAIKAGEGYYIPVGHNTPTKQLSLPEVMRALQGPMTNQNIRKAGHNLKYDWIVMDQHGLKVSPLTFDTMIAQWLCDPASHIVGLKEMAEYFLNIKMTHIEELIGKGRNQISMADVPPETVAPYAAADAEVTLRLMDVMEKRLKEREVEKLFAEMEMPLITILAVMEETGIALDPQMLKKMSGELSLRMGEIEGLIYSAVGQNFNINSTQQLSKILFERLRLEPPDRGKRTASGHYSTAADVLEALRGKHDVVDWVLEYREFAKLKSTYLDSLPEQVNPKTNRVHTSYSQIGSVTGRLASLNPNLQNIPTRTELGRKVRQGFIAAPGQVLLSVDYSQIELRIVAHMAGDQAMLEAFRAGQDIHAATAAAIYGVTLAQVTKDQRRHAKAINFGLIYGMSAFGLSRSTDLTLAEAENFVKAYFARFPRVKEYLDGIRRQAASQGYVSTLLGRRRYFPNLAGQMNTNLRQREEREAINAPIQGTAADIVKLAMLQLPGAFKQAGLRGRMLLQVHDELVMECPREELEASARVARQVMEEAFSLSIPLSTEARWGTNWGELQSLDTFTL
jgi:DNA polymerase-1